jgi:DMSO/TMAO reductase YedYZ molybdopterin-dependent catalytic subunit
MIDRRQFIKGGVAGLVAVGGGIFLPRLSWAEKLSLGPKQLPSGALKSAILDALPGKRPLIKKTFRPPNYETPVEYFNDTFTPNDAFFVRYHLADIPEVKADVWRLHIGGDAVQQPLELTLADLKRNHEVIEIAAVCQCSGNRRGLYQPHVPGIQWGYGAMGNAVWKGVRLRDVLNKAGVKKEALEVAFDGADKGNLDKTPDFIKSIPIWKALDENTLIAFEMNGHPLPHWNGYPARLVVSGWTATYWVKHLTSVHVTSQRFKGFWMDTAYRIPRDKFPLVERFLSQETETNTPITEMVVNSLITNLKEGQRWPSGQTVQVHGIAWDGGYGIQTVEITTDGGNTWYYARLGKDYGRFSWRQWRFAFKPKGRGSHVIMAKATNRMGQTQVSDLILNPAGYHHNVIHQVTITVG